MNNGVTIYTINTSEGDKITEQLAGYNLKSGMKHIIRDGFTFIEFKALLALTDNGLDDLLTQRGSTKDSLQKQGIYLDDLSLREAYNLILQNPKLLKTTILTDWEKVSYGMHGHKMFLSRSFRMEERKKMYKKIAQL